LDLQWLDKSTFDKCSNTLTVPTLKGDPNAFVESLKNALKEILETDVAAMPPTDCGPVFEFSTSEPPVERLRQLSSELPGWMFAVEYESAGTGHHQHTIGEGEVDPSRIEIADSAFIEMLDTPPDDEVANDCLKGLATLIDRKVLVPEKEAFAVWIRPLIRERLNC
jgi:hypothetical protein